MEAAWNHGWGKPARSSRSGASTSIPWSSNARRRFSPCRRVAASFCARRRVTATSSASASGTRLRRGSLSSSSATSTRSIASITPRRWRRPSRSRMARRVESRSARVSAMELSAASSLSPGSLPDESAPRSSRLTSSSAARCSAGSVCTSTPRAASARINRRKSLAADRAPSRTRSILSRRGGILSGRSTIKANPMVVNLHKPAAIPPPHLLEDEICGSSRSGTPSSSRTTTRSPRSRTSPTSSATRCSSRRRPRRPRPT